MYLIDIDAAVKESGWVGLPLDLLLSLLCETHLSNDWCVDFLLTYIPMLYPFGTDIRDWYWHLREPASI